MADSVARTGCEQGDPDFGDGARTAFPSPRITLLGGRKRAAPPCLGNAQSSSRLGERHNSRACLFRMSIASCSHWLSQDESPPGFLLRPELPQQLTGRSMPQRSTTAHGLSCDPSAAAWLERPFKRRFVVVLNAPIASMQKRRKVVATAEPRGLLVNSRSSEHEVGARSIRDLGSCQSPGCTVLAALRWQIRSPVALACSRYRCHRLSGRVR